MVRALGALLLAAHLTLVAKLMLRPLPVTWVYANNVRPLATINRLLLADPVAGARTILEGLLLLAPLGVLLPMVSGRLRVSTVGSLIPTVFLGASVSFAIEALQTTVRGQVFDVDSLLLNTMGVALAHLAVVPATRARLRRARERCSRMRRAVRAMPQEPQVSSAAPTPTGTPYESSPYEVAGHRGG